MAQKATRKRPTTEAHDGKRAEIIEHCAALFDKVGYHNTSMQMLADEVGLGKPTLYHYFPSKIAILFAIHDTHIRALLDGLNDAGDDPVRAMRAACIDILRQIANHPGYVRAFMDNYEDLEGQMRDEIRQARRDYFDRIKATIVRGVDHGVFRADDPTITTFAFLGMCNWAYKWYPPLAGKRTPEEVADALCEPFFEGLKVR